MKPRKVFNIDSSRTGGSYLVIHDGISQLLDESGQFFGIINIVQEPNECVLFGEWF